MAIIHMPDFTSISPDVRSLKSLVLVAVHTLGFP